MDTCQVATRPGEAGDNAKTDWVVAHHEHYRDCRRCRLGCERRNGTSDCDNHGDALVNQFSGQFWQPIKLIFGPAVNDCQIFAVDVAAVFEALPKCAETALVRAVR